MGFLKLCYYANSAPCLEDDPEFQRVATVFKNSNFNFRTLVRELFSSPLVTLAARTKTFTETEAPVTIQRQEHFCSAISSRLAITDACALNTIAGLTPLQTTLASLSLSIPAASYSRGAESPVVSRDPNLFFRASVENICRRLADEVVDKTPGTPRYSSTMPQPAIDDMVQHRHAVGGGEFHALAGGAEQGDAVAAIGQQLPAAVEQQVGIGPEIRPDGGGHRHGKAIARRKSGQVRSP